jgi:hypothetical protein
MGANSSFVLLRILISETVIKHVMLRYVTLRYVMSSSIPIKYVCRRDNF